MFKFLYLKPGLNKSSYPHACVDDILWTERRIVFFANGNEINNTEESNIESKEVEGQTFDDEPTDIEKIAMRTSEKANSVLDVWEYEFPADIDPEKIKEARNVVNEYYPVLQKLEQNVDGIVGELLGEMDSVGNVEAQNVLWKGIYEVIPEYTQSQLRGSESFDSSMGPSDADKIIKRNIIAIWKKYSDKPPSVSIVNAQTEKLTQIVADIAKNEFKMLKTIDKVREVLWDVHEKLQKQSIEERLVKSASRQVGIPLREGQELEGVGIRLKKGFEEEKPFIDKFTKRWRIKEVYVDKMKPPDLSKEDIKKYGKDEILMRGVWVALEERGSGRVHRMSTNRLRDYINIHDIKPVVHKKKEVSKNVLHLSEMGLDVKAGDTLEWDEMKINSKTNKPIADTQKVTILSIDDNGVKLDKKVLYRAFYDSPDLADHEYKDDMTLGEFVKWMNKYRPLPLMRLEPLLERLNDHYEYMNKKYKRSKNCHVPISLEVGEILHADAPGNPLFEVEEVDELKGEIKLKKNRTFTFPQFLRWVYENDIEPYDPELEAEKMKTYFKAGKKSVNRAREDAKETIDGFQKTGIWRDTLKKLREKGVKGIVEPDVPLRGDESVGAEKQSYSRIAQWLRETQWLRLDDIFKMFTSGWEYFVRNWERRQKSRYSSVGKNVPWFGTEFERINQQAETEEVSQFKEAMDQWGVPQIEETLYETDNQDQAKACFNVLAEKGMLRWDDKRLYNALNKFTDINHKLPIPTGDPYEKFGPGSGKFNGQPIEGKNVIDFLQDTIDSIWGEGSYIGWKRQNDGSIESAIQQSYNKAEELENDPKNVGGIAKELSNLLTRHMNGEWIDPTEYEGLLRFIIESGKAGGGDKIYYLLMGVNARNDDGRTILGWERVGRFVSKYSNQFPALDYFSSSNHDPKRDFTTGEMFDSSFVRSDFDSLTDRWKANGKEKGFFSSEYTDATAFLKNNILTSDTVQLRLEKAIRNAQNMDHDDTPFYIPALNDSEMESICDSTGGATKKFTIQGYKNAYVGFGMRMDALVDRYDEEKQFEDNGKVGYSASYTRKLITSFKSYMNYDGILDGRFKKKRGASLQRLGASDYQTGCVWDGNRPLKRYQDEMKGLIIEIANAYGRGDDANLVELPFKKGAPETAIQYFGPRFEKMIMDDDQGAKLIEIVRKHKFLSDDLTIEDATTRFRNKAKMYEYDSSSLNEWLPEGEGQRGDNE